MKKVLGLMKLMRFELPLSAGVCVILGQVFALDGFASIWVTISGFLSLFLVSASILVLNDYFDVESDKVNSPERPIPSGLVSPREALFFSIFLIVTGLILSCLISWKVLLIAMVLAIIGFLYNRYFKKSGLAGNLMVSFSVGMTFVFGGASVGLPFNKTVLFFGLIGALVDLGEEIAADSLDMEGDRLINSSSVAILHGKKTALTVSSVIFSLVITLSIIPFLLKWFTLLYLIPIGIMDLLIGFSTFKLLTVGADKQRKYIRLVYLGAIFGLILFLIMRLIGI